VSGGLSIEVQSLVNIGFTYCPFRQSINRNLQEKIYYVYNAVQDIKIKNMNLEKTLGAVEKVLNVPMTS
jgi:hypothetical protein